jgi:hypothetical protein
VVIDRLVQGIDSPSPHGTSPRGSGQSGDPGCPHQTCGRRNPREIGTKFNRLSRLRHVMQDQKPRSRAWRNGIGPPLVITELDEHRALIQRFNDRADLPARKTFHWLIRQQRYDIENGRLLVSFALRHHSTQQVTPIRCSATAPCTHAS